MNFWIISNSFKRLFLFLNGRIFDEYIPNHNARGITHACGILDLFTKLLNLIQEDFLLVSVNLFHEIKHNI